MSLMFNVESQLVWISRCVVMFCKFFNRITPFLSGPLYCLWFYCQIFCSNNNSVLLAVAFSFCCYAVSPVLFVLLETHFLFMIWGFMFLIILGSYSCGIQPCLLATVSDLVVSTCCQPFVALLQAVVRASCFYIRCLSDSVLHSELFL